jgi:predicted dithiol-disulfide oxidoreductase (DUF899 family)
MAEDPSMASHQVVSREEWLEARRALLAREKAFTKQRDELARARRALPWVRVDEPYVFETPAGKRTLAELFGPHSQLVVYHFMFSPEWDAGCKHCSFWADNFEGASPHLRARDVSFVAISRAPLAKLEAYRRRMGWTFAWVSSAGSTFNYDFGASFKPEDIARGAVTYNYVTEPMDMQDREGLSTFYKDGGGRVFHTYSTYARGIDAINGTYQILDLCPKGRDEDALEFTQEWVRRHDEYPR